MARRELPEGLGNRRLVGEFAQTECAGLFLLHASAQVPILPRSHRSFGIPKFRYRIAFWRLSEAHLKTANRYWPRKPKQPNQDTLIRHNTSPFHFYAQLRFRNCVKKSSERAVVSPRDGTLWWQSVLFIRVLQGGVKTLPGMNAPPANFRRRILALIKA